MKNFHTYLPSLALFVLPIVFWNELANSFVQGKELTFKVFILLFIVAAALYFFKQREISVKIFWRHPIFYILLGAVGITFFSTVFSLSPIVAAYGSFERGGGFIVFLFLFAWFVLSAGLSNRSSIESTLRWSFIAAVIVAFYAILQRAGFEFFFQSFDRDPFVGRSFSFVGNPSFLGQFLAIEFFIGLWILLNIKKWRRLVAVGLCAVLLGIIFSESRAAMLAFGFGAVLVALHALQKNRALTKKILVGIFVVFCIFVVVIPLLGSSRFNVRETALRSMESRLTIWSATVNLIKKSPVVGHGLETFPIYFQDVVPKEFYRIEEDLNTSADRVHNEFLEVVYSVGIFAGALYLFLIFYLVWRFFIERDHLKSFVLIALLVNFAQNQLSFIDINIAALLMFLMAALIALESKSLVLHVKTKGFAAVLPAEAGIGAAATAIVLILVAHAFIYRPARANLAFAESAFWRPYSYDLAVFSMKDATYFAPQYARPWYELIFLDASSYPRALHYLEQIEGKGGNFWAWKANYLARQEGEAEHREAYSIFQKLLALNPEHPNWIRSFADALYKNGRFAEALEIYERYLNTIPDFWKWDNLEARPPHEQKSHRIFFKYNAGVWDTVARVEELRKKVEAGAG